MLHNENLIQNLDAAKSDIREGLSYKEALEIATRLLRPGSGMIVDAGELDIGPTGLAIVSGTMVDTLEGSRTTRLALIDMALGDLRVATFGPNSDRCGKFSPDGDLVAFLSDRQAKGRFQLYLYALATEEVLATSAVDGSVEDIHWSPDGSQILLLVAGPGADASGRQGAVGRTKRPAASWMPEVDAGETNSRRRSAWIFDRRSEGLRRVQSDLNLWEIAWCGEDAILAITSQRVEEGAWYRASLRRIDVVAGTDVLVYQPKDQLGWPVVSSDSRRVAVVEAVCSDRGAVAGTVRLIELETGQQQTVDTLGADICGMRWRNDDHLLLGGYRGHDTAVLEYNLGDPLTTLVWSSRELGPTGLYFSPIPFAGQPSACAIIAEGYRHAPRLLLLDKKGSKEVRVFGGDAEPVVRSWIDRVEPRSWDAPDGPKIEGWLLLPPGDGPFPLIMHVHGGPVTSLRPQWQGRWSLPLANLLLLRHGYAVFQPNPRGSTGWGIEFVRLIQGDLNGADTQDLLSGIDDLVAEGIADPERLGVMGVSYGGNMTAWLVSQDTRFAAAVAMSPHCDQVSQHLLSNVPEFDELFLGVRFNDPSGKHHARSPIMHAEQVTTPVLNIAGVRDRCTPPNQATEFHNAIRLAGGRSMLILYPEEGHGIRGLPAMIDCAARMLEWFETFMSSAGTRKYA